MSKEKATHPFFSSSSSIVVRMPAMLIRVPQTRRLVLAFACVAVFILVWIVSATLLEVGCVEFYSVSAFFSSSSSSSFFTRTPFTQLRVVSNSSMHSHNSTLQLNRVYSHKPCQEELTHHPAVRCIDLDRIGGVFAGGLWLCGLHTKLQVCGCTYVDAVDIGMGPSRFVCSYLS